MAETNGLFDFFSSPIGQGLLAGGFGAAAAAGKGGAWNTTGAAGLAGLLGYNTAANKEAEREMQKFQLGIMKQAANEMQGGNLPAPANTSVPTAPATWYGEQALPKNVSQPVTQNGYTGPSLRTLQMMGIAGMKGVEPLFNMYKYQQDGIERKPGSWYKNPITGQTEYVQDPKSGMNYDPATNSVKPISGYTDFLSQSKGAEAGAQKEAEAKWTPLDPKFVDPQGRPIGGSVGGYLGGGQQNAQQQNNPLWLQARVDYANSIQDPQERQSFVNAVYNSFDGRKNADQLGQQWSGALRGGSVAGGYSGGRPVLQSASEARQQQGTIDTRIQAGQKLNDNWITTSYNPVVNDAEASRKLAGSLEAVRNIDINTGWGTEGIATGANVLTAMGVAPDSAKMFASNAQKFQSVAMDRLMTNLQAQKGMQTEGDADRSRKTFASLANTNEANQFIVDFAQAQANRNERRMRFYQDALPLAQQDGDLTEIDRRWSKIQGSLWDDPVLQKWKRGK